MPLRSQLDGADCLARADPLVNQLAKEQLSGSALKPLLERAQCRETSG